MRSAISPAAFSVKVTRTMRSGARSSSPSSRFNTSATMAVVFPVPAPASMTTLRRAGRASFATGAKEKDCWTVGAVIGGPHSRAADRFQWRTGALACPSTAHRDAPVGGQARAPVLHWIPTSHCSPPSLAALQQRARLFPAADGVALGGVVAGAAGVGDGTVLAAVHVVVIIIAGEGRE